MIDHYSSSKWRSGGPTQDPGPLTDSYCSAY